MKRSRINEKSVKRQAPFAFVCALTFSLGGCAYRLHPPSLPYQQHLKVVADAPETYVLRLRVRESIDYKTPQDGRVTFEIPAYRAGCSVYLFDKIRVRSGGNPYTAKTVDVIGAGEVMQHLSLKEIAASPIDGQGNHLLMVPAPK